MARRGVLVTALLAVAALGGCGSSRTGVAPSAAPARPGAGAPPSTKVAALALPAVKHPTVWLCFPGRAVDPCAVGLDTTVVRADGTRTVQRIARARRPAIDCFYVYPTVSNERRGNSDLRVGLPETEVAEAQAAQFSQVCRVYAPMYRQITLAGLSDPSLHADPLRAYADVLAAWRDYLARWNDGRGVVLIGHSQGAYILKQLVKREIDGSPSPRRLLVSAILLGGDVAVGDGPHAGGDFAHVPPCATKSETGCVVAYSSYDRAPTARSRFGLDPRPGEHVLCVNPAAPGGGAAPITPMFPTAVAELLGRGLPVSPRTPWVSFPGQYTARCERSRIASWLQINRVRTPGDRRPVVSDVNGPSWGLHVVDVNIALGQLVGLVRSQANAWSAAH